ncbi:glycosyltransferase family 4 protein [Sporosarcina siberiensis]|uniref:Glycosyltransferase family 4 protein n=1 Tax=Sporosarcina siberiensis TaxID=1365606 RepID=A0ABW4SDB2_9BACL
MKKDVAILCQYFYPEPISSATLPTELAIGLRERGLSVGVLSGNPGSKRAVSYDKEINGVTIKRVTYATFNDKKKVGRILNFFTLFVAMLSKTNYLRGFKTIIVYSNPPILPLIPYYLNKFFGNKFIFVSFDVYPDNALKMDLIKKGGVIHRLMNFINKRVYRKAHKVILLGSEMKDYVVENGLAQTTKNLEVIPNWYSNEASVVNQEIINEEYIKIYEENTFVVLYSGNMGLFQDMNTILEGLLTYKNNSEILFIFCGHGTKMQEVKNYIEQHNINNAKVYGFLTGSEYADVLKISDLCIVSLEQGVEGMGVPSKTYGYLAAGKPIIAIMSSKTDIAIDVLTYECGESILQGDVQGLTNAIEQYKEDTVLKQKHSINAKKLYTTKYTKEMNIEKYYELIIEKLPNSIRV